MSTFAIVLVVMGLMIAATRAPLIFAPGATRDLYMHLFDTDARMRGLGLLVTILGFVCAWAAAEVPGTPASIVFGLGVLMIAIGAIGMLLFPGWFRPIAVKVWSSFSEPTMRILGALAVIFGLLIAWYGLSL